MAISQGIQDLIEKIKNNNPSLSTHLHLIPNPHLNNGKIKPEEVIAIAEALKFNTTLIELNLYGNEIGFEGAMALAEALEVNTTLIGLNLYGNKIGSEEAVAIAEALKVNTTLMEINLHGNKIGSEEAVAIAEALKVNTTLIKLDLAGNEIGDKGAMALAEALKVNTTLIELDLAKNKIGHEEAALAIVETLRFNMTLTKLELSENQIKEEILIAIVEMTKSNKTIPTITSNSSRDDTSKSNLCGDFSLMSLQKLSSYIKLMEYLISEDKKKYGNIYTHQMREEYIQKAIEYFNSIDEGSLIKKIIIYENIVGIVNRYIQARLLLSEMQKLYKTFDDKNLNSLKKRIKSLGLDAVLDIEISASQIQEDVRVKQALEEICERVNRRGIFLGDVFPGVQYIEKCIKTKILSEKLQQQNDQRFIELLNLLRNKDSHILQKQYNKETEQVQSSFINYLLENGYEEVEILLNNQDSNVIQNDDTVEDVKKSEAVVPLKEETTKDNMLMDTQQQDENKIFEEILEEFLKLVKEKDDKKIYEYYKKQSKSTREPLINYSLDNNYNEIAQILLDNQDRVDEKPSTRSSDTIRTLATNVDIKNNNMNR